MKTRENDNLLSVSSTAKLRNIGIHLQLVLEYATHQELLYHSPY